MVGHNPVPTLSKYSTSVYFFLLLWQTIQCTRQSKSSQIKVPTPNLKRKQEMTLLQVHPENYCCLPPAENISLDPKPLPFAEANPAVAAAAKNIYFASPEPNE